MAPPWDDIRRDFPALKSHVYLNAAAGSPTPLAREFQVAELLLPARWRPACRAPVRGHYLLRLMTGSSGVARLVETALSVDVRRLHGGSGPARAAFEISGSAGPVPSLLARVELPRERTEAPWPAGSTLDSQEAAETLL